MLNVLYVFGGEKASGAEKVIDRLITNNSDRVNAHLMIAPGEFANKLIDQSISYHRITTVDPLKKLNRSSTGTFSFYAKALANYFIISGKVCRYIRQNKIDIVHANTIVPASYLLPAIVGLKLFNPRIKFIWSDHDLKYFSAIDNRLAALCVRYYSLTLAVSDAVKNKYHGEDSVKVTTLYNGLNINQFRSDDGIRSSFRINQGFSAGQIVIGLAGTIEPRKGQLALLKAFGTLQSKFPHIYLLLAGPESADEPSYVNEVFEEIKITNSVKYLGILNDMLPFYNGCDIIINNSSAIGGEPLGTTIYEAMSTGKIVLASDTGGTKEIITDGTDGFIFIPDNNFALSEKLEYVIENFKNLQSVASNAQLKVSTKFNIDVMTKSYNLILNDLTGLNN